MSAHWSAGVLVGLPLLSLAFVGLLVGGWVFRGAARRNDDDIDHPLIVGASWTCFGVAVLLVAACLSPGGYWPFKAEYHQWRPVTGTVTQVSSRIISDGNRSVNQRFVVKFAGHDSFYGCDDTRCATVKVGDQLALSCKREWQYASVSGYGCRWLS